MISAEDVMYGVGVTHETIGNDLEERTRPCPVCGKPFPCRKKWGFGVGSTDVCSWPCQRKLEKDAEAAKYQDAGRSKYHPVSVFEDKADEILQRLNAGEDPHDVAKSFKRSYEALKYWSGKHNPAVAKVIENYGDQRRRENRMRAREVMNDYR